MTILMVKDPVPTRCFMKRMITLLLPLILLTYTSRAVTQLIVKPEGVVLDVLPCDVVIKQHAPQSVVTKSVSLTDKKLAMVVSGDSALTQVAKVSVIAAAVVVIFAFVRM